jgi:hypothetical protein
LNQILKRQTFRFLYGSKVPAVTITVFITILEQNRQNSCQRSTKFSEVNVKNTHTSHIDKTIFVTLSLLDRTVLINMFANVIAEKSNKRLLIFTRTNTLFPVRNNPTFNHLKTFCSENRLGSTVPFCLFDRVLNVISIKDIDDNECQLKARDLIFCKIKCHLTKGSKPLFIDCNKGIPSLIRVVLEISKMGSVCIPVDVQDLPYWFCALCHRRETMMLELDQLKKTEHFQQ